MKKTNIVFNVMIVALSVSGSCLAASSSSSSSSGIGLSRTPVATAAAAVPSHFSVSPAARAASSEGSPATAVHSAAEEAANTLARRLMDNKVFKFSRRLGERTTTRIGEHLVSAQNKAKAFSNPEKYTESNIKRALGISLFLVHARAATKKVTLKPELITLKKRTGNSVTGWISEQLENAKETVTDSYAGYVDKYGAGVGHAASVVAGSANLAWRTVTKPVRFIDDVVIGNFFKAPKPILNAQGKQEMVMVTVKNNDGSDYLDEKGNPVQIPTPAMTAAIPARGWYGKTYDKYVSPLASTVTVACIGKCFNDTLAAVR